MCVGLCYPSQLSNHYTQKCLFIIQCSYLRLNNLSQTTSCWGREGREGVGGGRLSEVVGERQRGQQVREVGGDGGRRKGV